MLLIAFGVLICALGEMNLVFKGLVQQLTALQFEVSPMLGLYCVLCDTNCIERAGAATDCTAV